MPVAPLTQSLSSSLSVPPTGLLFLTGPRDYSLIQTPPSPPVFLPNARLKPHSERAPPSPDILGHLFTPFLCFLSAILSLHARTPLYRGLCSPLGGGRGVGGIQAQQWASSDNFMQDLAELAPLQRSAYENNPHANSRL